MLLKTKHFFARHQLIEQKNHTREAFVFNQKRVEVDFFDKHYLKMVSLIAMKRDIRFF